METSINKTNSFNDKQINNFAEYFGTLKRIRSRLLQEGYIIKDGRIIEPEFKSRLLTQDKLQNTYEN